MHAWVCLYTCTCTHVHIHCLCKVLILSDFWAESGHAEPRHCAHSQLPPQLTPCRNARNALPPPPCPPCHPPKSWAPIPEPGEFFPRPFKVIHVLLSLNACHMFVLSRFCNWKFVFVTGRVEYTNPFTPSPTLPTTSNKVGATGCVSFTLPLPLREASLGQGGDPTDRKVAFQSFCRASCSRL